MTDARIVKKKPYEDASTIRSVVGTRAWIAAKWKIEHGKGREIGHKRVESPSTILVTPCYLASTVDTGQAGEGGCGEIYLSEGRTVLQKAMLQSRAVTKIPYNLTGVVDPCGCGISGTREINRCEVPRAEPQIAVPDLIGVNKASHNLASIVDVVCFSLERSRHTDRCETPFTLT